MQADGRSMHGSYWPVISTVWQFCMLAHHFTLWIIVGTDGQYDVTRPVSGSRLRKWFSKKYLVVGCYIMLQFHRCRVFPWTRAVCCTCGHVDAPNDMFIFFCSLLCLIISIPREFTIYVCLIISLPRGFTIFVVFTTSLYILALYILALLWSYTSLGLMLFVVKTTWNKKKFSNSKILYCFPFYKTISGLHT